MLAIAETYSLPVGHPVMIFMASLLLMTRDIRLDLLPEIYAKYIIHNLHVGCPHSLRGCRVTLSSDMTIWKHGDR